LLDGSFGFARPAGKAPDSPRLVADLPQPCPAVVSSAR